MALNSISKDALMSKALGTTIPRNEILNRICEARDLQALLITDRRGNYLARNTGGLDLESEALSAYMPVIARAEESRRQKLLIALETHVPGVSDDAVSYCQVQIQGHTLHLMAFGREPSQRRFGIEQLKNVLLGRPDRKTIKPDFNRAS
jgi:hypothetical protein